MNTQIDNLRLDHLDRLRRGLVDARAMVERGWVQGTTRQGGRVCLEAALAIATRGVAMHGENISHTPDSKKLVAMFYRELVTRDPTYAFMKCSESHVWPWNDELGRTKADVLELMDAVLMNIEAQLGEHHIKPNEVTIKMRPRVPDLFWEKLAAKQAEKVTA